MKLNIQRFLKSSGMETASSPSRCRCPLHADMDPAGSMEVLPGSDGEGAEFACSDPRCGFRGDAVALESMRRGVGLMEAAALFQPGGELYPCLDAPMTAGEAAEYAPGNSARYVAAYLAVCRKAFLSMPERAVKVAGLSRSSPNGLVGDVGILVREGVPKFLSEAAKGGGTLVVYPFTMDGAVTHAVVEDASSLRPGSETDYPLVSSSDGVFGESRAALFAGRRQGRLFLCESPSLAARVRAMRSVGGGADDAPVVAGGLPLPQGFSGARHVVLFGDGSGPPSLDFALAALSAKCVVSGVPQHMQPQLRVLSCRPAPFDPASVDRMLKGQSGTSDLCQWAAASMVKAAESGAAQSVADSLAAHPLRPVVAEALSRTVLSGGGDPKAAEEVAEMLRGQSAASAGDLRLANGRRFRVLADSVVAVSPGGSVETLSNVAMSVDGKILRGEDGGRTEELLSVKATPQGDVPPARMLLRGADMSSVKRLRDAVSRAFAEAGSNPYVAFYQVPGYSWSDILGRLGDRCPVTREATSLGMDALSDVRFPSHVVRSDGSVDEDATPPVVGKAVSAAYGGVYLPPDGAWGLAATRRLLESCGNLYSAAYACGLMHILHQAVCGKSDPSGAASRQRHSLLYVETEPGIWEGVARAIHDTVAGPSQMPSVPYSRTSEFLEGYSGLGMLPLVARTQSLAGRLVPALDRSGVGVVGLADTLTAAAASGRARATYIVPCDESAAAGGRMDVDVDGVRAEFLPLVSVLLRRHVDGRFATASVPCLEAYSRLCSELGVPESPVVGAIATTFFQGPGMSGADLFFDSLHAACMPGARPRVNVVEGRPSPDYSFTRSGRHVFVSETEATVGRIVVDILNKSSFVDPKFDPAQLESEMSRRGLLAPTAPGMAPDRAFTMTRAAWDRFVARPPLEIGPVQTA